MSMTTLLRESVRKAGLGSRFAAWRAHFHAEEFQPGLWWILDGETRVGLVSAAAHFLELVNFFPGSPRAVEYPEIYHAPTSPGDRITLAKWINFGGPRAFNCTPPCSPAASSRPS